MTRRDYRNGSDPLAQVELTAEGGFSEVLELLAEHGFDGMAQAMQTLLNETMKLERTMTLGAAPYERNPQRRGHANGFKPKHVRTRLGEMELAVPQTRGVPWQRCRCHLAKNLLDHVPSNPSAEDVSTDLRSVVNAPDGPEAERLLGRMVEKYADLAPELASWLEDNVPEGLTVFALPWKHRRRLRTNNMLERLNREIKRRTRVATLFPNENSLLRLATAVLVELDEEWQTEKRYLSMNTK